MNRNRVLVAMSGGVDSSVAAALLVKRGYDVIGVTMKLFCYGEKKSDRECCSIESVQDAQSVADLLGIPHYVRDFEEVFERDVIKNFVSEYEHGRTPIPCVRCNSFTKFRDLVAFADSLECRFLATGHYASVKGGELFRGTDKHKDQTYFLWGIDKSVLSRLLLPVGELTKPETRNIAGELGLKTANKPDSVEVCFVPDNDYVKVLEQRIAADSPALTSGPVVLKNGEIVGEHEGYARYTIGQRRGLPGGFPEPMYVTEIRPLEKTVVIGPASELYGDHLRMTHVNWLASPLTVGNSCHAAIRYRSPAAPATVNGFDLDTQDLHLRFTQPVRGITPGQSAVLYDGEDRVLGGGIIV